MRSDSDVTIITQGFLNYLRSIKKTHLLPAVIQKLAASKLAGGVVVVESAVALSARQKNQLARQFKKPLTYQINPRVLGGLRITDGDEVLDLSLATKLDTLANSL